MNRLNPFTLYLCLICVSSVSAVAQVRSAAPHEKVIRDTYRKLEIYNAAAQVFQNEPLQRALRPEANLEFELTDFRAGHAQEIASRRYAELVTLPTGAIVSLTHRSHSLDQGPEESMFVASWTRGQYAPVFDPQWTITDVLNFEPARYYDIASYTSYQVTVRLEGKTRTYRALALFHEPRPDVDAAPEFWDAVVNGLNRVWEEKRPPYKAATRRETSSLEAVSYVAIDSGTETDVGTEPEPGTEPDPESDVTSDDFAEVVFAVSTPL